MGGNSVAHGTGKRMSWSVLRVAGGLDAGHRAEQSLQRIGFDYYNPKTNEDWKYRGRIVTRTVQLFPSYMFVFIVDRWHVLSNLRGIFGVLRDKDGPLTVPEYLITKLRFAEKGGLILLPSQPERFAKGDKVRLSNDAGVLSTKFAVYDGMCGIERAAILMRILGTQVRIVVNESALEFS